MRKQWPLAALVLLVVLYFGGQSLLDLWADYLWYRSNGQLPVFLTLLEARSALFLGVFLLFFLVLAATLRPLIRALPTLTFRRRGPAGGLEPVSLPLSGLSPFIGAGLVVVALLVALPLSDTPDALRFLAAIHAPATGSSDPILGLPLGFYLFHLPVYDLLSGLLQDAFLFSLVLGVLLGLPGGQISFAQNRLSLHPVWRKVLMRLSAGLLLVLSLEALLLRTKTLLSSHQALSGASYVDVHARIPAATLLSLILLLAALAFLLESFRTLSRLSVPILGIAFFVWAGGLVVTPWILSRFVVLPDQFNRERPYILHNIAGTRKAFHLDGTHSERITNLADLTPADLADNRPTIRNIRLWDHRPMLTTVRQLQQIRTYYTFPILAPDRYRINGVLRQVLVAPREISYANLPSPNWINLHLTYTHGHGLIMSPVNRVSPEGLPTFWVRDIPPQASIPLAVSHSRIYYGDQPSPYAIVNTRIPEFDYPKGRQNIYNHYDGTGGIRLSSSLRKLLYSYEYGTFKIFLSTAITDRSRILVHRDIFDIVERLAPFLRLDPDVVPVIGPGGHLVWMMDAYTTSDSYPYASEISGSAGFFHTGRLIRSGHRQALSSWPERLNYIRNSVKILVDPKNGTASFYVVDPGDPVLAAYKNAFPTLFRPASDIPQEILPHLRFPPAMFSLSALVLSAYHMTDPQVFFNREDLWSLAERDGRPLSPYYMVLRLPGESQEEYVMMLPYTPAHRDNLSAWLVGRSKLERQGKLRVYRAPKERLIYGPNQIEARIDQRGPISKQLTLWNQQGSRVVRGTLLIIPIAHSLLYVEPLYLSATSPGALPELRRVIVSMGDRVVMRKTLDRALTDLFSGTPGPNPTGISLGKSGTGTRRPGFSARLKELGREADEALRRGDLATFGDRVQKILRDLRQ